jgi:hypothetical protein
MRLLMSAAPYRLTLSDFVNLGQEARNLSFMVRCTAKRLKFPPTPSTTKSAA